MCVTSGTRRRLVAGAAMSGVWRRNRTGTVTPSGSGGGVGASVAASGEMVTARAATAGWHVTIVHDCGAAHRPHGWVGGRRRASVGVRVGELPDDPGDVGRRRRRISLRDGEGLVGVARVVGVAADEAAGGDHRFQVGAVQAAGVAVEEGGEFAAGAPSAGAA